MLPRIILYNAVTADGRMDWFAPDLGLFYSLAARCWHEDAILVGADTLLAAPEQEDPSSATDAGAASAPLQHDPNDTRPLLVVPDSRGRIRTWRPWRVTPYWRDLVVLCSRATPPAYLDGLRREQIAFIVAGDDHVDLQAALAELHDRYGIGTVRVDSGGTLNGALLRAGLVDEVSILISPCLVGGTSPRTLYRAPDLTSADGIIPLRLAHVETLGDQHVWLRYDVVK